MNSYLNKLYILGVFVFLALMSCKKSNDHPAPDTKPVPTEHGVINGDAVSKKIGAAGGTIATPDGNIKLEIPVGAVTTETNFTIQPVTNTLPSATGTSYRLMPENVDFKKDIKISMQYTDEDLKTTNEDHLYMAYQDAAGYWRRVILTDIDKTNKTLSVNTRHFSDWSIERTFYINLPEPKEYLLAKQELGMLVYMDDVKDSTEIILRQMVPDKHVETWFVTGPGKFNNPKLSATYYIAPDVVQEYKEVAVGVRLKGLVDKIHPERPGNAGLVIVQIPVTLVPDEFFTWTMDEIEHVSTSTDGALIGTYTTLLGVGATGSVNISLNGAGAKEFETGGASEPDKFTITVSIPQPTVIYNSTYYNCNETKPRYGKGKLIIGRYENIGGFISGAFHATVYTRGENCDNKSKQVIGSFRLRRKL